MSTAATAASKDFSASFETSAPAPPPLAAPPLAAPSLADTVSAAAPPFFLFFFFFFFFFCPVPAVSAGVTEVGVEAGVTSAEEG